MCLNARQVELRGSHVGRILLAIEDITERRQMQNLLKENAAKFRSVVDSNMIGIAFIDADGKVGEVNDAFLKIIGYSRFELQEGAFSWKNLTDPIYRAIDEKAMSEIRSNGVCVPYVKEYIRKDGRGIPILIGGAQIAGGKHETVFYVLDITESQELEKRKDEFIVMASHELKTPVTSIKALIQLLQKMHLGNPQGKEGLYLQKVDTQIDKLTKLIADLLDVSKIISGKLEFNFEQINYYELVKGVIEDMQQITPSHELKLEGLINAQITGDRERLGQVLINLLSNAIKYSPNADKVIVTIGSDKDQIITTVQDFGVGIPLEYQERIFDRFYRAQGSKSKTFPGLGIGLYISHEIVARHDGKLAVNSKENKGSTFYLSLPLVSNIKKQSLL
jgi:PAS domain S-box-containing protein